MPFDTAIRSPSPEVVVLRNAMGLIHKRENWCQRSFTRDKPPLFGSGGGPVIIQHCAVNAIEEVCPRCISDRRVVLNHVFDALTAEIDVRPGVWQRFCFWSYSLFWPWRLTRQKVIWFNDRRQTDHADVINLLQRAIVRLEMETLALV